MSHGGYIHQSHLPTKVTNGVRTPSFFLSATLMITQRHVDSDTSADVVIEDGKFPVLNQPDVAPTAFADDEQRPPAIDIGRDAVDVELFGPGDRSPLANQGHGRPPPGRRLVAQSSRLLTPPSTSSIQIQDRSVTTMAMEGTITTQPYIPLLRCPACSPPARLVAPTTLHCGHTVCAKHVRTHVQPSDPSLASTSSSTSPLSFRSLQSGLQSSLSRSDAGNVGNTPSPVPVLPSCPLPTCRPRARQQVITPNIPPESTVAYYPPISQASAPEYSDSNRVTVAEPRLDVSVGRVLHLLEKAESWEAGNEDGESSPEDSDDTDEELYEENVGGRAGDAESTPRPSKSGTGRGRRKSRPASNARKRSRKEDHWNGSHYRHANHEELKERFNKDLSESLTCEICFMLLYQPVTTPCQHTFCAKCLQRSLDHGTKCPLCRQEMPPFSYFQDHPFNKVILAILLKAFPDGYGERGRAIEEEERDGRLNTPIFVCQLSFPGIPTLLHFYEPRYRLMLRRCLESPNPRFGMIMPQRTVGAGSSDYGTMLEIKSVQMLPDGRSMVETIGTHRFRIMETGTLDGYMVGRIERIDDIPGELEDEAERSLSSMVLASTSSSEESSSTSPRRIPPPTTDELIAICHAFLEQLRNGTAPWVVQRLNNTYGPMPDDVSRFSYWMAQVLPIEDHEKAKLLVVRSPRARLRLVVHWIEQLNSNWWFSRGCSIS